MTIIVIGSGWSLRWCLQKVLADRLGQSGNFAGMIDFSAGTVHWRADADKKRVDWTVPLPSMLLDEINRFRVKLGGAFGGLVVPSNADAALFARCSYKLTQKLTQKLTHGALNQNGLTAQRHVRP